MEQMQRFAPHVLRVFAQAAFQAAGAPEDIAAYVADHLIDANLCGHDSHGVLRIPAYIEAIRRGVLDPAARPIIARETAATVLVDGNGGFGHTTTGFALESGISRARDAGVAAVAIRHCGHIGRLGAYTEEGARRGYIVLLCAGSAGKGVRSVVPFGAAAGGLGTNPWSIGIPSETGEPLMMDFATAIIAGGKVMVARARHEALPEGYLVGPDGRPSTDTNDYFRGGALHPFGGHKGSALSLMAAMLGGLSGASGDGRVGGTFMLVIDPAAFGDARTYCAAVAGTAAALKALPAAPGAVEVMLPGEPERRARAQRSRDGIPLPADTLRELAQVAAALGIAPLEAAGS
jgi:LDH2 family malate/lactate/ureidoglycolate dehydrogenase